MYEFKVSIVSQNSDHIICYAHTMCVVVNRFCGWFAVNLIRDRFLTLWLAGDDDDTSAAGLLSGVRCPNSRGVCVCVSALHEHNAHLLLHIILRFIEGPSHRLVLMVCNMDWKRIPRTEMRSLAVTCVCVCACVRGERTQLWPCNWWWWWWCARRLSPIHLTVAGVDLNDWLLLQFQCPVYVRR